MNTQQYNHFNSMSMHEPPGTPVVLKMASGELIRAFRKEPTKTKGKPNTYYRDDDTPIDFDVEKPLGWTYP